MSWQTYVDDHLMCEIDDQHLTAAAILGHDGSVWAQSASFPQFKPEEITAIMTDFDEPGSLAPTGLYLGGTKYMVIQGEPGAVIRGKKVDELAPTHFSHLSTETYIADAVGKTSYNFNLMLLSATKVTKHRKLSATRRATHEREKISILPLILNLMAPLHSSLSLQEVDLPPCHFSLLRFVEVESHLSLEAGVA
ncbi:hypothetical protein MUK42_11691 [Musa troglodytarum]|uniref:Profilin n=1 Tax=Musa troglodytarum TaxID=320322 RepID=A0A9E7KG20_9LILI|nr:hypothetical protein MUK42_11691 [Musa troglodytarum]